MRIVDLAYWMEQRDIDWDKTLYWLDSAGLRTAAWIMLEWLNLLTKIQAPPLFRQNIQPGVLRSKYLHYWVARDLASRFLNRPLLIQAAFTLPAHDKPSDAIRAIKTLVLEKRQANRKLEVLASTTAK